MVHHVQWTSKYLILHHLYSFAGQSSIQLISLKVAAEIVITFALIILCFIIFQMIILNYHYLRMGQLDRSRSFCFGHHLLLLCVN